MTCQFNAKPDSTRHLGALRPLAAGVTLLLLGLGAAQANQSLSSSGYGLTVGPVFNRNNLDSAGYNPANPVRLIADDEKVRIGVLAVGGRYEIGAIDNITQLRDDIKADVDRAKNATAEVATEIANKINAQYLPTLASGANGNVQAQASLLAPVLIRTTTLPGVWSFSANAQVQAGGMFRQSSVTPIVKLSSTDPVINNTQFNVSLTDLVSQLTVLQNASGAAAQQAALEGLQALVSAADQATLAAAIQSTQNGTPVAATYAVTTASAVDVKLAQVNQISLGYSTDLTRYTSAALQGLMPSSKLDIGVRVNAYQARLYRQLVAFVDADGNSNTVKLDSSRDNMTRATALGLDLGASLSGENYQVGATIYNLNGPTFKYPDLALDPSNATNLAAARQLASEGTIGLVDSVQLKPHMVIEGSLISANKRWMLQSSLALNETTDFVGAAQKHVTASVSYNAERYDMAALNYLIPSVRVGYNKNLVGSQLATVGLGLSWGVFSIDANVSEQSVTVDGSKVPRSAGVSLSIAEKF